MPTQMESTPRSNRANNSHGQNAKAQLEINSSALAKVTQQDLEPFNHDQRHELIAIAAYYLAEGRNFEPGHETEDWLTAESQLESPGAQVS
jgi:hypothetical protein